MRRPDWVARLWETVQAHEGVPFEYGIHDCSLFAARCVDAMTDSAWADSLDYHDKRGAVRFLKKEGGLESAVSRRLGAPIKGRAARRGDICFIEVEDGNGLGVCLGSSIAVAAEDGITFYPLARAYQHWRVE